MIKIKTFPFKYDIICCFMTWRHPSGSKTHNWCQALFDLWSPKEWFTDYDVKICGNKPKVFFDYFWLCRNIYTT